MGEGVKGPVARRSLEMLADARLCGLIPHTAANGLPLAAQQNERMRKVALLDVGIAHALFNVATTQSQPVRYQLLNLPHYLAAFAREILRDLSD